jgi:apolipoprotein N-acyltransferase
VVHIPPSRIGAHVIESKTPPEGQIAGFSNPPELKSTGLAKRRAAALVLAPLGALPLSAPLAYTGALLSGLLYFLAFGGIDVWPLTWVAWVPLIVAMHRQTTRRATLLGWLAGLTMNVTGFIWLQQFLRTFSGFPAAICFLFVLLVCAYQGGRMALLGWLFGRATARGWPAPVVFGAAFVASELVYPLLFPWYYAATVHQVPLLTQVADIGGPILVGLVLVAANLALAELVIARAERRGPSRVTLAVGAASVAFACIYGAVRIRAVDAAARAAPQATVGVVQANMGLMEKRTQFDDGLRRHLQLSADLQRDQKVDFVVWSETSAMRPVHDETYRQELGAVVGRRVGVPAIFGAVVYRLVRDQREYVLYNTAISSDASGVVRSRYDKEYLLTFGEYIPFGETLPVLYSWSPNSGHFSPGTVLDPLIVDLHGEEHPVTALICYEDILPRFTNDAVRHGNPELLVNITNDAWFGDTTEPWEHLALAQFRAIEHRRYFVRGTNSGVSAIIDPVGRVVAHSGTFRQDVVSAPIHWMRARTAYELLGDWPWLFVSLAVVAGAFRSARQKLEPSRPPESPA